MVGRARRCGPWPITDTWTGAYQRTRGYGRVVMNIGPARPIDGCIDEDDGKYLLGAGSTQRSGVGLELAEATCHGVLFSCRAAPETKLPQYELAPARAFPAARVDVLSVARETGKAQNRNTRAARNERRFSLILPGHDFQHTHQPIMSHGCPAPAQLALTSAQRLPTASSRRSRIPSPCFRTVLVHVL